MCVVLYAFGLASLRRFVLMGFGVLAFSIWSLSDRFLFVVVYLVGFVVCFLFVGCAICFR